MLGMNARDALGHMEDAAMIGAVHRAANERSLIRSASMEADRQEGASNTMESVVTAVALKERSNTIDRLKGQLDDVAHNRNYAAILFIAASKTIDHVVRDFAKAAGVSEDEMRKRYNMIRTQHFNQQVNEGIERGWFQHDPRAELSDEQRKWYVPGLDADHGF